MSAVKVLLFPELIICWALATAITSKSLNAKFWCRDDLAACVRIVHLWSPRAGIRDIIRFLSAADHRPYYVFCSIFSYQNRKMPLFHFTFKWKHLVSGLTIICVLETIATALILVHNSRNSQIAFNSETDRRHDYSLITRTRPRHDFHYTYILRILCIRQIDMYFQNDSVIVIACAYPTCSCTSL